MIKLKKENSIISVTSPYNADFIKRAKQIGGKWNSRQKTWDIPEEAEKELRQILAEIYGWLEGGSDKKIEIEFNAEDFEAFENIKIGTVVAATRFSRDTQVKVASGFRVTKGEFKNSGGSAKYPAPEADGIVMKGSIPLFVYDHLSKEERAKIKVQADDIKSALETEKETLLKRLAEIEKELKKYEGE